MIRATHPNKKLETMSHGSVATTVLFPEGKLIIELALTAGP
jgi:hypothetical protein